jgi:hypothetical protein
MKKVFFFLAAAVLFFTAAGCNNVSNPDKTLDDASVTEKINSGSSVIDFNGAVLSEDAAVNNAVTVENADFGGKTLTVNVGGVTLKNLKNINIVAAEGIGNGDLSIEDCTVASFTVAGGGSNSIHITGSSSITTVVVVKAAVHIVLEDTATAATMQIETTGVSVQGSTSTTIVTMQIAETVDTVSVAGGTINTISVSKSNTGTPTITVTGAITIIRAETVDESTGKATSGSTFVVTTEAKNDGFVTAGITGAEEVQITGAELVKDAVKTAYETGDTFDYTGLSVKLTYNNSAASTVTLNSGNCSISGFDNATEGSQTVSFTYNGIAVTGSVSITVTKTTKEYQTMIDDAVDLLLGGQYDEGIAKIAAAYESDKNDTTRMYYALAQLASISVDDSVKTLLTKNYGFTDYPAKLNSLFSTDWMKKYVGTKSVWCETFTANTEGSYVRVKATEASSGGYSTWGYKQDSDGDWIESRFSLTDVSEDNNGSYLIDNWAYRDINGEKADSSYKYSSVHTITNDASGYYVRVNITDAGTSSYSTYGYKQNDAGDWVETYLTLTDVTEDNSSAYVIPGYIYEQVKSSAASSGYLYSVNSEGYEKYVSSGTSTDGPGFNLPDWFADTEAYKESLINSAQSTQTISYLLAANLITCNPDGYNTLVDNILNIFGTKFMTAKQLVSELSEESVVIPAKVLNAFNLTDMLGDSTIKIGKSEINILIGAMEIVQGSFQYVSSYNLSANLLSMKSLFNTQSFTESGPALVAALNELAVSDTFIVRNSGAVATAKATFIDASDRIMDSYTYITQKSSQYPDGAKDTIKMYGDIWYSCLKTARSTIKDGGVFYIPSSYPTGTSWPTTGTNAAFGIDMGKVFTAGNFTNILDRKSDGSFQVYLGTYTTGGTTIAKLTDDNMPDFETGKNYGVGLLLNKSVLTGTLPGLYQEDASDADFFIPMISTRSSSVTDSSSETSD